jgi:hypothetical protein
VEYSKNFSLDLIEIGGQLLPRAAEHELRTSKSLACKITLTRIALPSTGNIHVVKAGETLTQLAKQRKSTRPFFPLVTFTVNSLGWSRRYSDVTS